jgi:hypothetical protein
VEPTKSKVKESNIDFNEACLAEGSAQETKDKEQPSK